MDKRSLPTALLLLTAACSQAPDAPGQGSGQPGRSSAPPPVLAGLPPVAALGSGLPHSASTAGLSLAGNDEWNAGGPVALGAGLAGFFPGPGELAWAIYEFPSSNCEVVNSLNLANTTPTGTLWVGISDYDSMHWELRSSTAGNAAFSFAAQRGQYSNGSSCFVAVIAYDGAAFDLSNLTLEVDDRVPPTDYISTFGNGDNQVFECLKLDGQGDIFVAGKENTIPPPSEFENYKFHNVLFGKFSQDGTPAFVKRWLNDTQIGVSDMAVDSAGNFHVLVQFRDRPRDAGVFKLSPDGILAYATRLAVDDDTGGYGAPHSIVLDGSDCAYVFGYVSPEEYLIRLDESGAIDWAKNWELQYDGSPYLDFYQGRSLVFSGGTLYVQGTTELSDKALLLNFDPDGSLNWQKKWASSSGGDYMSYRLVANPAGGLTFAGYNAISLFEDDFELLGISASGALLGGMSYDADDFSISSAFYGPDGKLTLIGFGSSGSPQYYSGIQVARFNADYTLHDAIASSGALIGPGAYACAAYDLQGRLYICGPSQDPNCLAWSSSTFIPQTLSVTLEDASVALSDATYTQTDLSTSLEDIADTVDVGDVDGMLLRLAL